MKLRLTDSLFVAFFISSIFFWGGRYPLFRTAIPLIALVLLILSRQYMRLIPKWFYVSSLFVLGLVILQMMPVPELLVSIASKTAYQWHVLSHLQVHAAPPKWQTFHLSPVRIFSFASLYVSFGIAYLYAFNRFTPCPALRSRFLSFFTLAACVFGLGGLIQKISGNQWLSYLHQGSHVGFSSFINQNHAALFLSLGLAAHIYRLRDLKKKGSTQAMPYISAIYLPLVILSAALISTNSKLGFTSLVGLWIIASTKLRHATTGRLLPILISIGLIVYLSLETQLFGRLFQFFSHTDFFSDTPRVMSWKIALKLWAQNPVFGVGLGAFDLGANAMLMPPHWYRLEHAEGDLWELLASAGMFGCLALAVSGYLFFKGAVDKRPTHLQCSPLSPNHRHSLKNYCEEDLKKPITPFVLTCIVLTAVYACFIFWTPLPALLIAVSFILALMPQASYRTKDHGGWVRVSIAMVLVTTLGNLFISADRKAFSQIPDTWVPYQLSGSDRRHLTTLLPAQITEAKAHIASQSTAPGPWFRLSLLYALAKKPRESEASFIAARSRAPFDLNNQLAVLSLQLFYFNSEFAKRWLTMLSQVPHLSIRQKDNIQYLRYLSDLKKQSPASLPTVHSACKRQVDWKYLLACAIHSKEPTFDHIKQSIDCAKAQKVSTETWALSTFQLSAWLQAPDFPTLLISQRWLDDRHLFSLLHIWQRQDPPRVDLPKVIELRQPGLGYFGPYPHTLNDTGEDKTSLSIQTRPYSEKHEVIYFSPLLTRDDESIEKWVVNLTSTRAFSTPLIIFTHDRIVPTESVFTLHAGVNQLEIDAAVLRRDLLTQNEPFQYGLLIPPSKSLGLELESIKVLVKRRH